MISHKRIMLSAIAASFLVAQGLYATDITDDSKLVQDSKNKGNYTYKSTTNDNVKGIKLGNTKTSLGEDSLKHLTIEAKTLNFDGNTATTSIGQGYSFDLTADSVSFKGNNSGVGVLSTSADIIAENGHSTINAKNGVTMENGFIRIANGNFYNDRYNGSLTINGDLKLTNSAVINFGQAGFNVNGKVTASNSFFGAEVLDLSRVTSNGFFIMSASKGFDSGTKDVAFTDEKSNNKGFIILHSPLVDLSYNIGKSDYANNIGTIDQNTFEKDIANTRFLNGGGLGFYDVKLNQSGNALYVKGDFAAKFINADKTLNLTELNKEIKTYYGDQKTALEKLYTYDSNTKKENGLFFTNKGLVETEITKYNTEKTGTIAMSQAAVDTAKTALDEAKKGNDSQKIKTAQKDYDMAIEKLNNDKKTLSELNNRLAEYNKLIEDVKNKTANLDKKIADTKFNISTGQKGQIFASLATSNVGGKIAGTADYNF